MQPISHEALPYAGQAAFTPSCVALVDEALALDARLLVLAAGQRLGEVRDALGDRAEDVTFVPVDRHGRNPSRITTMLDSFQSTGGGRRSVGITDWGLPGRSRAVLAETQLAESLLNIVALQSWSLDVVCLYDSTALDVDVLTDVRRTHAVVRGEPGNADYRPDLAGELFAAALHAGPDGIRRVPVSSAELAATRRWVRAFARTHGIDRERTDDFVLAVNEVVTNSLRHGGGSCVVALWEQDDAAVCEVVDAGHIVDPLAGRLMPPPNAPSGRGLWLANHLCDLVQIRSSERGTVVRLYVDRL